MLRRLLYGLIKGFLVGGLVALGLIQGLGLLVLGTWSGYGAAAGTGLLTGLVAGKPFWRKDASVEAGLRAAFGALVGAGLMFAVRRWLHFPLDLGAFGLGSGPVGMLTATSLPLVTTVLALWFEIDNTGDGAPPPRARVTPPAAEPEPEVEAAPPEHRRRRS